MNCGREERERKRERFAFTSISRVCFQRGLVCVYIRSRASLRYVPMRSVCRYTYCYANMLGGAEVGGKKGPLILFNLSGEMGIQRRWRDFAVGILIKCTVS